MTSLKPSLMTLEVVGRPYPKGSLRHVGNGRMVEQLKGSGPWRETVSDAASVAVDPDDPWFPVPKPQAVAVDIVLHFHRPKSTPHATAPTTRSTGDIDKHCRNILDALTDGGVFEDDSQVTHLFACKRYVPDDVAEGAQIQVRYAV